MTEDEAQTKWCPMARQGEHGNLSGTEEDVKHIGCCIASDCMMWKWLNSMGQPLRPNEKHDNKNGYCGLAK